MTALSIVAFLVPVIYGLNQNGWSMQASFMPRYVPPRVGLEIGQPKVRFEGGSLVLGFQATNTGEVKLHILSIDATAYGPDGAELGRSRLAQAVMLAQGESKTMTLNLNLDGQAIQRLISYFRQGLQQVTLSLKGEARVRVFSSTVTAPFTTSFTVSPADIGV